MQGVQVPSLVGKLGSLKNQSIKQKQCCNRFSKDLKKFFFKWTSLVAQWIRLYLPMQGTQVWPPIWEDLLCHRAAKPVCRNYWACALEPGSRNYWSLHALEPGLHNRRSHCNEKPEHHSEEEPRSLQLEKAQQWRPSTTKTKILKKLKRMKPLGILWQFSS